MQIGILGTGVVGQTLASALADEGHEVVMGSRDPAVALANTEANRMTGRTLASWHEEHADVRIATFAETAAHGDVVMNATSGVGSLAALEAAGSDQLDGKILIDVANPLVFSQAGVSLSVANTDSLAEQIQRAYPNVRVVKALNTLTATLMVDPGALADGDHTLPIAGNDEAAKDRVTAWLKEWFGWRDVMDLGDLTAARGMEAYLLLWLPLRQAVDSGMLNIKVVRLA
jgi:8-hydroxy-5-deazaflavin:NADPH oxidoreductase